jgi:hypothetical protein
MITPPMMTAVRIAKNGTKAASETDCRNFPAGEFDCFSGCILRSVEFNDCFDYIKLNHAAV